MLSAVLSESTERDGDGLRTSGIAVHRERQDRTERHEEDPAADTHTHILAAAHPRSPESIGNRASAPATGTRQNASSGRSMASSVVDSMIRRSAPRRGSTSWAKNRAAATLPS